MIKLNFVLSKIPVIISGGASNSPMEGLMFPDEGLVNKNELTSSSMAERNLKGGGVIVS